MPSAAKSIEIDLMHLADQAFAKLLQQFFQTGPGEYGEGDLFLGIKVPVTRSVVKRYQQESTIEDAIVLLNSKWHECRFAGAVLLTHQYRTGTMEDRNIIYREFIKHPGLNNWDLIDFSTPRIVGVHLLHRSIAPLRTLAKSKSLWKRRIAIVATLWFIREGRLDPTFELCETFMREKHDLMHKACGWALREAGKKDRKRLKAFLDKHIHTMPRTMLRYAIEKFPEQERRGYLKKQTGRRSQSVGRGD